MHMLEHFYTDHAIVVFGSIESVHVGGDDFEIIQIAAPRFFEDVLALGARVGDAGDAACGKSRGGEERERSPTVSQFEDALAVLNAGTFGGECKSCFLRGGERVYARRLGL